MRLSSTGADAAAHALHSARNGRQPKPAALVWIVARWIAAIEHIEKLRQRFRRHTRSVVSDREMHAICLCQHAYLSMPLRSALIFQAVVQNVYNDAPQKLRINKRHRRRQVCLHSEPFFGVFRPDNLEQRAQLFIQRQRLDLHRVISRSIFEN